ncbi:Golgin subfamily A member 4 [Eumeta japonica]|uniref:Golgin subfamily A member 4 n=1 Tax=Eumeta variegata TaxID=151549 RepID=A0A4C1WXT1_EUMVA|nr:Golgin subfamily A member 4 [Eumeta japonica]
MFKKLKDKLAEEVKSSPQKIQQFAQAAQAAVTSASSSISDITNHDLFSIGDSDSKQNVSLDSPEYNNQNLFQDVSLLRPTSSQNNIDLIVRDGTPTNESVETQRQRKLSNSSFASDVSFKLPFYDSPTMYHMQSDMEISASEAEERVLPSSGMSLERVTKDQLYGAYRRTQERYNKYRTRYADLARHYKLLERENAKARSVLVETQDKALRRISELREQCNLEQSAKAHLERALREEIDEKNMKIDSLNTKIKLLQSDKGNDEDTPNANERNHEPHLIDLSMDTPKPDSDTEITGLNDKILKMEQLIAKYKESLKNLKEKNSQLTSEISVLSNDLNKKNKENEQLQIGVKQLTETRQQIQELKEDNEELKNKLDAFEFNKSKEIASLELDIKHYQEEISNLQSKIDVFTKREEEYAISLAENKLCIHKELEEKESEIKSLKANLTASKNEIKSLEIILEDYKQTIKKFEEESSSLNNKLNDINSSKNKLSEMEDQIQQLKQTCQSLETSKAKHIEEFKCLELQLKQETAEKLAMIDRNNYLQSRNSQILEENMKKAKEITELEKSMHGLQEKLNETKVVEDEAINDANNPLIVELKEWKDRYLALESEIQEERIELVKLQSEIEKLLTNHELSETRNVELTELVSKLQLENSELQNLKSNYAKITSFLKTLPQITSDLKKQLLGISSDISAQKDFIFEFETNVTPKMKTVVYDFIDKHLSQIQKEKELKINELNLKLTELNDVNSAVSNESKTLKHLIQEMETKIKSYKDQILEIEKSNEQLSTENKLLNEKSEAIIVDFQNKEFELHKLQNDLQKENAILLMKIAEIEQKRLNDGTCADTLTNEKILALENRVENLLKDLEQSSDRNSKIEIELLEKENKLASKETEIHQCKEELFNCKEEFKAIMEDNNLMHEKCERLKQEKEKIHEKTISVEQKLVDCERQMEEYIEVVKHLDNLNLKIKQTENDLEVTKTENECLRQTNTDLLTNLNSVTEESNNSTKNLEMCITELKSELESLKNEKTILITENEILKEMQNSSKQDKEDLEAIIKGLKDDFLLQSEEMLKLKSSVENMSVYDLENTNKIEELKQETLDYKEKNATLIIDNEKNIEELKESKIKYVTLSTDYETIKEKNKLLMSDIEGLQAHLMKVSKDNSQLNDKLREIIANSETCLPNNDRLQNDSLEINDEIENLKLNCQKQLEKIEDLERQNSILSEENLELQDQLKLQNVPNNSNNEMKDTDKELELCRLKDKYDLILEQRNLLEKKLNDLEYVNSSSDKKVQHLEEKNQKLKLSHEKLERRLDEALVSLRHLRALEENTELEYLRNILYEYLTGSGTHSITLAKVLAAVVKFDDRQTQLVLQREKERQGLADISARVDLLTSFRIFFTQLEALNELRINFFFDNAPTKKNPGDSNQVNGLATKLYLITLSTVPDILRLGNVSLVVQNALDSHPIDITCAVDHLVVRLLTMLVNYLVKNLNNLGHPSSQAAQKTQ